jgi:hypothetical protein
MCSQEPRSRTVYSRRPRTIVLYLADNEEGMAKAVADVNNPEEKQGGFASDDSDITGFSHMHDSGTGGVWFPSTVWRAAADMHNSRRPWATSQFSPNLGAQVILSTTVSLPRQVEPHEESMALLKPILDILR